MDAWLIIAWNSHPWLTFPGTDIALKLLPGHVPVLSVHRYDSAGLVKKDTLVAPAWLCRVPAVCLLSTDLFCTFTLK